MLITLEVLNYRALLKRNDVSRPGWFALEVDVLSHADFFDVTGDEFKVFIWILNAAVKNLSEKLELKTEVVAYQCRVEEKSVHSVIEKLQSKRWNAAHVTSALRARDVDVTPTLRARDATDGRTDGQDTTDETRRTDGGLGGSEPPPPEPDPLRPDEQFELAFEELEDPGDPLGPFRKGTDSWLLATWNDNRGPLPKALAMNAERKKAFRARWTEHPEAEDWVTAIKALASSPFHCGGGQSGWKASLDFLLQPRRILQALEGQFTADGKAKRPMTAAEVRGQAYTELWHHYDKLEREGKGERDVTN